MINSRRVPIEQTSILLEAQATYYPARQIKVFIPKLAILKLVEGYERPAKPGSLIEFDDDGALLKPAITDEEAESNQERSLRRTRKAIKDYALCNDFNLFATFTFATDRQDIDKCKARMAEWLKNRRKRGGKFPYLIVPEFHKDHQSLHFHALIGGYKGVLRRSINPKTNQPLVQNGRRVYEIPSYTHGFTNVKEIENTLESRSRVATYLHKYITKDMPLFFGQQRYWVSKGLKKPIVEDNPERWYEHIKPEWSKETDFGTIMYFDVDKHPLAEIFWEKYYGTDKR